MVLTLLTLFDLIEFKLLLECEDVKISGGWLWGWLGPSYIDTKVALQKKFLCSGDATLIKISLLIDPSKFYSAHSHVLVHCTSWVFTLPVDHVPAGSSIQARHTGTLVHIHLAVDTIKPRQTFTGVHADQVTAGGSVPAGLGLTLVNFCLTVDSWCRKAKLQKDDDEFGNKKHPVSASVWLFWSICSDKTISTHSSNVVMEWRECSSADLTWPLTDNMKLLWHRTDSCRKKAVQEKMVVFSLTLCVGRLYLSRR